jgi:hypothetical protein
MAKIVIPVTDDSKKSVWGPLDEIGLLLDLKRLPGERNHDYRTRLFRVFTRRTDSTYQGLLNGITYELGLGFDDVLILTFTGSSDLQPRVMVEDGILTLYSDYVDDDNFTLIQINNEPQLNLREEGANELSELITLINSTGSFTAALVDDPPPVKWSYCLVNFDTNVWISDETIPSSTRFTLEFPLINDGMFFFGERKVFKRLRISEDAMSQPGDFYIDIATGEVTTTSLPSGEGTVRYQYRDLPKTLEASPIALGYIGSRELQRYFFTQLEVRLFDTPLERYINNIPNDQGVEIINELFRVSKNYWGK